MLPSLVATLRHAFPLALALAPVALPAPAATLDAEAPIEHPLLWRIDAPGGDGDSPSWLFGTIHLADPRVLALATEVEQALDDADAVYTELAFDRMSLGAIVQSTLLPDGQRLDDVLPPGVYDLLVAVFRKVDL